MQAGLADIFAVVELWKISISIFLSLAAVVVSCIHFYFSKLCGCCGELCTFVLFLSLVAVVCVFVCISTVSTTCIFIRLEAV